MRLGTTSFAYIFNYISLTSEIAAFIFNPRDKTYHLFRFSFCHSVFVCYVCLFTSHVCLSVYVHMLCMSICLCTYVMSVYLPLTSVYLSMYICYVCLSAYVPMFCLSIYPCYICLFTCYVCLSVPNSYLPLHSGFLHPRRVVGVLSSNVNYNRPPPNVGPRPNVDMNNFLTSSDIDR